MSKPALALPDSPELTPHDWFVIRLALDVVQKDLEVSDTDLSTADKAKVLSDFKALAAKLAAFRLSGSSRGEG